MSKVHCYFCGGTECKYENWKLWVHGPNAFDGVYSNWITDDILAMARPSTKLMEEYRIVKAFVTSGITTIINLQEPGEHEQCGNGIHESSGFSYLPETWMSVGIQFYNFGWPDMDIPEFSQMLNLVQVMSFSVSQGGKAAVHCHAGLGRTGLSIACYLVYAKYMRPMQAIELVRAKRPGSVQTKRQQLFVQAFEEYLQPMRVVFYGIITEFTPIFACIKRFSWTCVIERQANYLHGQERRALKYIPKLLHATVSILEERKSSAEETKAAFSNYSGIDFPLPPDLLQLMYKITRNEWSCLAEAPSNLLVKLMLFWLTSLDEPFLSSNLLSSSATPAQNLQILEKSKFQALAYLVYTLKNLFDNIASAELFRILAICLSDHSKDLLLHPFKFELHASNVTDSKEVTQSAMLSLKLESLKPSADDSLDNSIQKNKDALLPLKTQDSDISRPSSPGKRLSPRQALTSWASSISLSGKAKMQRQISTSNATDSFNSGATSSTASQKKDGIHSTLDMDKFLDSVNCSAINTPLETSSASKRKSHKLLVSSQTKPELFSNATDAPVQLLPLQTFIEMLSFLWDNGQLSSKTSDTDKIFVLAAASTPESTCDSTSKEKLNSDVSAASSASSFNRLSVVNSLVGERSQTGEPRKSIASKAHSKESTLSGNQFCESSRVSAGYHTKDSSVISISRFDYVFSSNHSKDASTISKQFDPQISHEKEISCSGFSHLSRTSKKAEDIIQVAGPLTFLTDVESESSNVSSYNIQALDLAKEQFEINQV